MLSRTRIRTRPGTVLLLTALFVGCTTIVASGFFSTDPNPPTEPDPAVATAEPASSLPPGSDAMRVAIDPETGELVSSAPEADKELDADLARMLSRSDEGLVAVRRPDGGLHVDLQGRFMSASLARIEADGGLTTTCVSSHDEATAFLDGETDRAPAPEPEVR